MTRDNFKNQTNERQLPSWLGIGALIVIAVLYCFSALSAAFWNDNDVWSNVLPIIHFRHSILDQHVLPLYTELWYGGWYQWANPLWSFLYLPSTVVWLLTPLDWGARIIFLGHLVFSLLVGRRFAALFLDTEIEKVSASIILASPIFPALTAGHLEKVMSWGWILLAMFFLFNEKLTSAQRGLGTGISLGIVPLTGANYGTLYAGILLLPLILSYRDRKLLLFFLLGAMVGLLHLPSVWHMIGYARTYAKVYIEAYSVDALGILSALATGFSKPLSWETWTPIGIPMIYLFGLCFFKQTLPAFSKSKNGLFAPSCALLISIGVLLLLASGIAYQGHSLLDSFRIPARALGFVALGMTVMVLLNSRHMVETMALTHRTLRLLLFISAVQVAASAWVIRPEGSPHSPYEASVQQMADILKADDAKSVWFATEDLGDMYISVGLTRNNIALPNVYYGDMGQTVKIHGMYCGYSFDHLLAFAPVEGPSYDLNAKIEWSTARGEILLDHLVLLGKIRLDEGVVNIYRVVCDE